MKTYGGGGIVPPFLTSALDDKLLIYMCMYTRMRIYQQHLPVAITVEMKYVLELRNGSGFTEIYLLHL
jgi:hypothetical protein